MRLLLMVFLDTFSIGRHNKRMDTLFSVLVVVVVIIFFSAFLYGLSALKKKKGENSAPKNKTAAIRDAVKRLAQDPHNAHALNVLSDLYYRDHAWEKALPLFELMLNIAEVHREIDLQQTSLRQGICALKLNRPQDALRGLLPALRMRPENFEVNYNLAQAYYQCGEFEKAVPLLKKALMLNREASDVYGLLGLSFYNLKKFRDALPYLKRALNENPENKEVLFAMADSMQQSGFGDKAMKVFMHLRPDPQFGAKSCLAAGIMHMNANQLDKAITDFEIALKHSGVPADILVEVKYRLAHCYLQTRNIDRGLALLREIQAENQNYRDVGTLINRYQELKQNANLQIYLSAGNSDFVALCRKIVSIFYEKAFVKILDLSVTAECAEVFTEIETTKWEDTVVFRFYRTTGSIGELYVRDFHARIRDTKAGRGICFTAGTFTAEARNYTEGRPIDLIEKERLVSVLKRVDSISSV
ncbi:restriction endonuclease [Treponema brennaborense DSM 12168]|uniref:Restriction endonuclease n=2 Tax=Treponema TaxID=157 RepID=F4LMC3_TREBD|nr:restriction endonuclease [Treponema brennaborense DSM 12168]